MFQVKCLYVLDERLDWIDLFKFQTRRDYQNRNKWFQSETVSFNFSFLSNYFNNIKQF